MQMTEDKNAGRYIITGYGKGFITVNDNVYQNSLIISPEELVTDWIISNPHELSFDRLEVIESWELEILLIGTGKTQKFPENDLIYQFIRQGIGCEIMDSAAACRTYNILLSESRNVVAALLTP